MTAIEEVRREAKEHGSNIGYSCYGEFDITLKHEQCSGLCPHRKICKIVYLALTALEAEKPTEDIELRCLVNRIDSICNIPSYEPKTDSRVMDCMNLIKAYHEKECAKCGKKENI